MSQQYDEFGDLWNNILTIRQDLATNTANLLVMGHNMNKIGEDNTGFGIKNTEQDASIIDIWTHIDDLHVKADEAGFDITRIGDIQTTFGDIAIRHDDEFALVKAKDESLQAQINAGKGHRDTIDTNLQDMETILEGRIKTLEDKPYNAPHSGNGSGGQFGWFSEETCIGGVSAFGQEVSKGTCIPNWLILAPIGGIVLAAGIIKM